MELVFDFAGEDGTRRRRIFDNPVQTIVARDPGQVVDALARVDAARRAGHHVAGYVAYEAAPAFDAACRTRPPGAEPVLQFGVFGAPRIVAAPAAGPVCAPQWHFDVDQQPYCERVERIRNAIGAGDVYQVNLTLRARAALDGDARAYYEQLRLAQDSDYCAFLDFGPFQVLSASPELFFRWRDGVLVTRPMKGTAPRGRWPAEDAAHAAALYESDKNRAENLMIVDLLRNDLVRLSQPGGVRVPRLFAIERYPTLFQMTSTVTAATRPAIGLGDVFAALFPCGSITGAPKYKAMEIIAALEDAPRGIYCGAIGYAAPDEAVFNVAIRTVTVDGARRAMVCGLGGGITWPSNAREEFDEVRTKAEFLARTPERYALFETLLLENAAYLLRSRHVERIRASAASLGFVRDDEALDAALYAYAAAHPAGRYRVRLTLARDGAVAIDGVPLGAADLEPVPIALAREPVSRDDRLLFHKTTRRALYERHLAGSPGAFDVLLWNAQRELTEFTRGNLVAAIDGQLLTPPLDCGLLPGTMRAELLAQGRIVERRIAVADLQRATALWFINSVRGWLRAELVAAEAPLPPQAAGRRPAAQGPGAST